MRNPRKFRVQVWALWLLLTLALAASPACGRNPGLPNAGQQGGRLIIFHAGSLAWPVKVLSEAFRKKHSGITIQAEASGSREAIRKVTELGKEADVILSADARLIDEMMVPQFAAWNIRFARNEMVLAYTPQSRLASRFGQDLWYAVLLEEGVTCGSADPQADPAGYRARMVWQLAEQFYNVPGLAAALEKRCAGENVRPKSVELVALLQSGNLDSAFLYRSVAIQNNLPLVLLPPEINLCCPEYAPFYQQAVVELRGPGGTTTTMVGEPIVYGVTIPRNAPHPDLAVEFVRFLLEPEAQALLEEMGQPAIVPPDVQGRENLPAPLKALFPQP